MEQPGSPGREGERGITSQVSTLFTSTEHEPQSVDSARLLSPTPSEAAAEATMRQTTTQGGR